ncbi:hypothetical protein ABEB36_013016 [Hypothenemus hampei]|uniref:Uncharacterized protein n=1 Tax=Hypothenemus hampei TaxID=57062 RepID=A0ABD1E7D8_HYPHA
MCQTVTLSVFAHLLLYLIYKKRSNHGKDQLPNCMRTATRYICGGSSSKSIKIARSASSIFNNDNKILKVSIEHHILIIFSDFELYTLKVVCYKAEYVFPIKLGDYFRITAALLQKVALETADYFPSENSTTYYVPYNSKNKSGPKGKLYTKLINIKSSLKVANACQNVSFPSSPEHSSDREIDGHTANLNFLKVGTEPISRIFEAWEQTYSVRRKIYMNTPLHEIMKEFPCLKLKLGLELIETDFNRKHSDLMDVIYCIWEKLSKAILAETKERKIELNKIEIKDTKINALLALPYLFGSLTDANKLNTIIQDRKDKLEKFGLTIQPFAVILPSNDSSSKFTYLIIVDGVQYRVDTGIRCLELLFKLLHGIDIDYPSESEHIWLFIEQTVFKITPKKMSPVTSNLIADINYHLQN